MLVRSGVGTFGVPSRSRPSDVGTFGSWYVRRLVTFPTLRCWYVRELVRSAGAAPPESERPAGRRRYPSVGPRRGFCSLGAAESAEEALREARPRGLASRRQAGWRFRSVRPGVPRDSSPQRGLAPGLRSVRVRSSPLKPPGRLPSRAEKVNMRPKASGSPTLPGPLAGPRECECAVSLPKASGKAA